MPIKGDKAPAKKVRTLFSAECHSLEDHVPRGQSLPAALGITAPGGQK